VVVDFACDLETGLFAVFWTISIGHLIKASALRFDKRQFILILRIYLIWGFGQRGGTGGGRTAGRINAAEGMINGPQSLVFDGRC
jgi:hypothetical protein